jgi:uncharacterized membrane protein
MNDYNNDEHLDVCQDIEVGLKREYEEWPALTDAQCVFALDNAKIAIKKEFGFAKNERVSQMAEIQGIINWCVRVGTTRIGQVNDLTLKEYVARIDKVRKSVKRHSTFGRRGYYEFIQQYV